MREFRTYGSVRGAPSNGRPYRDPRPVPAVWLSQERTFGKVLLERIAQPREGVRAMLFALCRRTTNAMRGATRFETPEQETTVTPGNRFPKLN